MSWNLLFLCEVGMRSIPVEPWDQVGNKVDVCEDLVDEREKSASSNDDVARMQVSICLTLGRAGLVKAEVPPPRHSRWSTQSRALQPAQISLQNAGLYPAGRRNTPDTAGPLQQLGHAHLER